MTQVIGTKKKREHYMIHHVLLSRDQLLRRFTAINKLLSIKVLSHPGSFHLLFFEYYAFGHSTMFANCFFHILYNRDVFDFGRSTCHMWDADKDTSATVKHVNLAHVYIQKLWRSSVVECKNAFCVNSPTWNSTFKKNISRPCAFSVLLTCVSHF